MENRELTSKWRKERFEKYKAKLMVRNGGKKISNIERIIGFPSTCLNYTRVERKIALKISANPKPKLSSINPPKCKPKENKASLQRKMLRASSVLKPSCTNSFVQNSTPNKFREYNSRRSILDVKGLSCWLTKRGKLDEFKKLKEFYKLPNLDAPEDEINSEINTQDFSLKFCISLLQELMDLMKQGYSKSECFKVVENITERCCDLTSEPIYYECLGMLKDPTRIEMDKENNPPLAEKIGEVGEKLKTVNIKPLKPFEPLSSTSEECFVQSFSIQYAVIERKKNQNSPEFAVTPVRRGTRSRITTPASVKCVSNLSDLTPDIKSRFSFKPNKFLF